MTTPIPALEIPVAWGDMDAFQHVNNTVFLRWCESARLRLFEDTGLIASHKSSGIGPILASIQCRFRTPVLYPESVRVQVQILRLGEQDFELDYQIYAISTGTCVASAQDRCVIFDYTQQTKTAFPPQVRSAFEARYQTDKD